MFQWEYSGVISGSILVLSMGALQHYSMGAFCVISRNIPMLLFQNSIKLDRLWCFCFLLMPSSSSLHSYPQLPTGLTLISAQSTTGLTLISVTQTPTAGLTLVSITQTPTAGLTLVLVTQKPITGLTLVLVTQKPINGLILVSVTQTPIIGLTLVSVIIIIDYLWHPIS